MHLSLPGLQVQLRKEYEPCVEPNAPKHLAMALVAFNGAMTANDGSHSSTSPTTLVRMVMTSIPILLAGITTTRALTAFITAL